MQDFDARLIVKNTGWLYLRSFAVCLAGFVTARIVLRELGVEGFGLYAAIAGVVGVIAFLGGALDETFRRYFSAEIGRGATGNISAVFAASMGMSVAFALVVLFVGEAAGLAFVRGSLIVPEGIRAQTVWVCQACLFAVILMILTKPFVAHVVASECMYLMTVVGTVRAFLLLAVVSSLSWFHSECRLLAYAYMLVGLEAIELGYWCVRNRKSASAWLHPRLRGSVARDMLRFCFLSSFKSVAFVVCSRGWCG